jgi:hypothetical protein
MDFICGGKRGKSVVSQIDNEDADLLNWHWYVNAGGYAKHETWTDWHKRKRKMYLLHRMIMERIVGRPLLPTEEVDHANRDRLDNRRSNLSVRNRFENAQNTGGQPNFRHHLSERNIYWTPSLNAWRVQVKANKKAHHGGVFTDLAAARKAAKDLRDSLGFYNPGDVVPVL